MFASQGMICLLIAQVEKAEALLLKIRDGLKGRTDVKDIVEEFYETLPHSSESAESIKLGTAWLSRKQDLCQASVLNEF